MSRRALAAERVRTFIRATRGTSSVPALVPVSDVSCHGNQEGDIGFDVRSGQDGDHFDPEAFEPAAVKFDDPKKRWKKAFER